MIRSLLAAVAFATLVVTVAIRADAQTPPSPAPSASPVPSPAPSASAAPSPPPKLVQLSGFGDAAYTSHVGDALSRFSNADPVSGLPVGAPFPSRVFDYYDRSPDLQNLNVQAAITDANLFGKVELSAGTDADIIASYPASYQSFDVTQAYLGYTFGRLSLQAGKFETLAGAEVIESPLNLNFSRSILTGFAEPFTHTGARLTYAVTPHLNVLAGANFGWDEIRSTNGRYTAEYGLQYNPSAAASLSAAGYTGYEQLANYYNAYDPYVPNTGNQTGGGTNLPPSAQGQRTFYNVVGTLHPTGATTLTASYDRGLQQNFTDPLSGAVETAGWSGLAGYFAYTFSPKFSSAIRYEGFHDPQGYRTGIVGGQFWREGTFTLGFTASPSVTLRAEFRHDLSDHNVFLTAAGDGLTNQNSTVALETLVKF